MTLSKGNNQAKTYKEQIEDIFKEFQRHYIREESNTMLILTKEELANFNGENGNSAYISIDGIIYDISNIELFKQSPYNSLKLGSDVTEAFDKLNNGDESILRDIPMVGLLAEPEEAEIMDGVEEYYPQQRIKIMSSEELKKYNGENGSLAYVAIEGIVYDIWNLSVLELFNGTSLRYETDEAYITVKKKKNNWEIITDGYFALAVDYGKTAELTMTILTENEKKQQEMEEYIKSNVEIVDYNIGMCSSYTDDDVPGLTKLSIKNNGNKDIESVKVRIDFYDEINNVIFTDDMTVVGSLFDNPIKAGYSWKMEDDKFFEIEDVPEEVNIQRANLYVIEVSLSENKTPANLSPEEEYIRDYVDLTSAKVEMCSSYKKDCPGLRDVSVKNRGDKDIESLTVTVYFQDSDGRDIAEDSFMVIGNYFDDTDGLKANYSWAMENDRFYEIKNLADEVDISRYRVEISKITFE